MNTRDSTVIVYTCPTGSESVIITTPVYDDVGPGFGPNNFGDRPLLGYVAREACYEHTTETLVAWQCAQGYEFLYNDGGEDTFDILQQRFGKLQEEYHTFTEGLTLPNGGEVPKGMSIDLYRFQNN